MGRLTACGINTVALNKVMGEGVENSKGGAMSEGKMPTERLRPFSCKWDGDGGVQCPRAGRGLKGEQ